MTEYKIKLLQDIQTEKSETKALIKKTFEKIESISRYIRAYARLAIDCEYPDSSVRYISDNIDELLSIRGDLISDIQMYKRLDQAEDKIT